MKKISYNKLIRDNILEIIEANNKIANYRIIDDLDEVKELLFQKLKEEVEEVIASSTRIELFEELADVLEVLYRIAKINDLDLDELEKIRQRKKENRGGFERNLFLESVEEE